MLRGFDVSAFQGPTVRKADFVFIKATEGSGYTSSRFNAQWADAKAKGILRGAYHFARPEQSSGASQADRLLAKAKAVPGEMLCLDLEASKLNQAKTNTWAKAFGDRLREKAPGVATVVYMGSGYASNGTGRDLADHFDWWWYPQYPSTANTSIWRTSFSPWLPGGLTCGWKAPHIWQWTDNFAGLDANITNLTIEQLAGGGGQPTPMEADMLSGKIPAGKGDRDPILFPAGAFKTVEFGWDNTYTNPDLGITRQGPAQLRIALHQKGRKGTVPATVTVGAALDDTKGWADNVSVTLPAGCDRIDVTRLDDGVRSVGFCVA